MNSQDFMSPTLKINLRNELKEVINQRNVLTTRSKLKVIKMLNNSGFDSDCGDQTNNDFDKRKRLRFQAMGEIVASEKAYIKQLEKLIYFFVNPLKEGVIIDVKSHTALFGQLELIWNLNKELLLQLETNLEQLGSAFLKLAPFFKLYSVYAFDYKNSLIMIQNLTTKNPTFRRFIEGTETRPEVQAKLNSLMIVPIQRIPRYKLLLQQVLLYTSPSDKDYKLIQDSIKQIENTVSHINTVIEDQENTQILLNLQNSLTNRAPNIVKPSRKIIKEGILHKLSSNGTSMRRYCILLSDIFMYCKIVKERSKDMLIENSLDCCCIFPLKKCKAVELFAGKFKLSCLGDGVIFSSDDVQDSRNWISAIKETIELHVECRKTIRKDSSKRKPIRKKNVKYFENEDVLSPGEKKGNFEKVFYGINSSELELNKSGESSSCFKSRKNLKRRHSFSEVSMEEVVIAKKAKTSFFSSLLEKLGNKKIEEPTKTRSILTYKSENQNTLGEPLDFFSPNHSFASVTNTPSKKRVKFDEENLITSSITYQRQIKSTIQYTGIIPPKKPENRSMLTKIIDFTSNLFE